MLLNSGHLSLNCIIYVYVDKIRLCPCTVCFINVCCLIFLIKITNKQSRCRWTNYGWCSIPKRKAKQQRFTWFRNWGMDFYMRWNLDGCWSREVSKPRDWYLKLLCRFGIWQVHQLQYHGSARPIWKRSANSKIKSRGFESLRDFTIRRLIGYWNRALGLFWFRFSPYNILLDILRLQGIGASRDIWIDTNIEVIVIWLMTLETHRSPRAV